ncbi:MAG: hypothetical protein EHM89_03730 [Acidobacteria bacterium]|nr:MAG: hypothetical protein EHM89_20335 [Acidobacteriota bacterium]RPH63559.1 MAG: hypothetical protein EHM89_03730 [Acidobacteriota bacterium]
MRRYILNLLLLFVLMLQGVVGVAADMLPDENVQQHCSGHESERESCRCCPEGVAMNAGCSIQCSVSQAPISVAVPARVASYSMHIPAAELAIKSASYAPLNPPPIA